MKKFIGTVNGVEYNDREAFNEAARKAMEENPCLLSITSYEKYEPDEDPVLPETKKNIVEMNDFVIERESDKFVDNGKTTFVVPEGLEEKLRNCDNKDEVRKEIISKMMGWKRCLDADKGNLEYLEKELEVTKERIEAKKRDVDELEAGIEYYNKLLACTGGVIVEENPNPCNNCRKTQYTRKASDIFGEMGKLLDNFGSEFSSYLRKKGLFD